MRFIKLFLLAIAIAVSAAFTPADAKAQPAPERYTKTSTDTSVNVDTVAINFNELSSNVTSLTVTVVRLTDTAAGKVYLEGRNLLNGTWHKIDSLTVTDVASQEKVFPVTSMSYYDYRSIYYGTNTGTRILKLTYVRRPDDR